MTDEVNRISRELAIAQVEGDILFSIRYFEKVLQKCGYDSVKIRSIEFRREGDHVIGVESITTTTGAKIKRGTKK